MSGVGGAVICQKFQDFRLNKAAIVRQKEIGARMYRRVFSEKGDIRRDLLERHKQRQP